MSAETLGDAVGYLKSEMTIEVEFYGAEPVGIELPQTVDLKVVETVPAIKGATATNQMKPATLETGVVVQVPPFVGRRRRRPRQHGDRRVPRPAHRQVLGPSVGGRGFAVLSRQREPA